MRASDIRLRVGAAMAAALALAACGSSGGSSTKPTGALAACGSGAKTATAPATASSESWPYPNGDLANTRDAAELDDLLGERVQARAGLDVQAHRERPRPASRRTGHWPPIRSCRTVSSISRTSTRTSTRSRSRPASSRGSTARPAREERTGAKRRRGRRRKSCTGSRRPRPSRSTPRPASRSGSTAICSATGQGTFGIQPQVAERTRLPRQPVRLGARRRRAARAATRQTAASCGGSTRCSAPTRACSRSASARAAPGRRRSSVADGSVTYGIGNPYQIAGAAIAHPSRRALHRQRCQPRRRDREAPLVLPGRDRRFQGLRHADLADLGDHRRCLRSSSAAARWATSTR